MTDLALTVDDDVDLVLRERWVLPISHQLIMANLDRLRQWENWALTEQSEQTTIAFGERCLREFVEGTNVPLAMRYRGMIVGSIGARIDLWQGTAQLGYWIDRNAEGHGVVTRSAAALLAYLAERRGVERCEIRAAVGNARSRAVAERLGFEHEATLRGGLRYGDTRLDEAVYGLLT